MNQLNTRSRLTLGTANFGMTYGVANRGAVMDGQVARMLLDTAWAGGIRQLDTASAYLRSEDRIGTWSEGRDKAFAVYSKVGGLGDVTDRDIAKTVEFACQASLKRLRCKTLSGYFLHSSEDVGRPAVMDALSALKDAGLATRIGVSIYEPEQGFAALETGVVDLIQSPFNLLDRRLVESGLAAACRADGVSIFARSAFVQGLLSARRPRLPDKLKPLEPLLGRFDSIAARSGKSVSALALRFALDQPAIDSVVIGVQTEAQLCAALEACCLPEIEPEIVSQLAEIAAAAAPECLDPRKWPPLKSWPNA